MYIKYTPNLGLGIAVPEREREQGGASREHGGALWRSAEERPCWTQVAYLAPRRRPPTWGACLPDSTIPRSLASSPNSNPASPHLDNTEESDKAKKSRSGT